MNNKLSRITKKLHRILGDSIHWNPIVFLIGESEDGASIEGAPEAASESTEAQIFRGTSKEDVKAEIRKQLDQDQDAIFIEYC